MGVAVPLDRGEELEEVDQSVLAVHKGEEFERGRVCI